MPTHVLLLTISMNPEFLSFSVLKQLSHIFNIYSLSIRLIVFYIIFWVANEWLSWLFPFNFYHKLLFMTENKFSTGAYCGEYWGKKKIASNFSCIVSADFFAEWELALSIMIIIPLFLIHHFEWMNLSRSIRYSMNLNELTVFIRRWEKLQPFEEISDITKIDLSKIIPLISAILFFLLHEYNWLVCLFMSHSSIFTTKSVISIVLNNFIRYMALLISNKSNGMFEGLQEN